MTNVNSDHWSDYWSRGCLTSLPQDFVENYDGEVAEFWAEVFSQVPARGAVVDLCTGNGAIALLAAQYSKKSGVPFDVTAVDAAQIRPDAIGQQFPSQGELLRRIHFLPNTRVEELELTRAGFDLVTSQYGLEYCDWQSAAETVFALLKPGGRLVLVSHSATSDIMAFMEQERREYAVLESLGFFESAAAFLQDQIDDPQYRAILEKIALEVNEKARLKPSPLFNSVLNMSGGVLAMSPADLAVRKALLETYHAQMRHGLARLADMLRVNHAILADPQWYSVFERAGLECTASGELRYRGLHHAGVCYRFVKPDGSL
jgi:ubiquinone/menaquinone biosynthesis C-methylase UbiE